VKTSHQAPTIEGFRAGVEPARELYLDLLKKNLTRTLAADAYHVVVPPRATALWVLFQPFRWFFARRDLQLVQRFDPAVRREGGDWPVDAETMIGVRRLDNIQACAGDVISRGVPGDFIETGVWRGGATIFMRGLLKAYGVTDRRVWVADSFQGLPKPSPNAPRSDHDERLWAFTQLAVSLDQVKANFARYELLDDQVAFLPGFFAETLPAAPVGQLALLRLDGDLYESTRDALVHLYPRVASGGYVIVDDYHNVPGCRQAVDEHRARAGSREPLQRVDENCVFWRRD
jgi:O-methyltransferase